MRLISRMNQHLVQDKNAWVARNVDTVVKGLIEEHKHNIRNILNASPEKYFSRYVKYQKTFQRRVMHTLQVTDKTDIKSWGVTKNLDGASDGRIADTIMKTLTLPDELKIRTPFKTEGEEDYLD